MKNDCKCALRTYMTERLSKARSDAHLSQDKFAELLMMDTRSYAALEHGDSLCCTLTFVIYLVFICNDVDRLVCDLRKILVDVCSDERSAS